MEQKVKQSQAFNHLSASEKDQVLNRLHELDTANLYDINVYANDISQNIAQTSKEIVKEVSQGMTNKSTKNNPIAKDLTQLNVVIKKLDPNKISGYGGLLGYLSMKLRNNYYALRSNYISNQTILDELKEKLIQSQSVIRKDFQAALKMRKMTMTQEKELELSILALQLKLDQLSKTSHDVENEVTSMLLKRQNNLLASQGVITQNKQALNLAIYNYFPLMESTKTILDTTLPLMQSALATAIMQAKQKNLFEMNKKISDTASSMLVRNARSTNKNTKDINTLANQPVIDPAKLKEALLQTKKTLQMIENNNENNTKMYTKYNLELQKLAKDLKDDQSDEIIKKVVNHNYQ